MCEYSSARAKCTPQESHNNVENACHRKASNAGSTKWNKTGQAIIWQFKQIMHVVTFTWGRQSEMQTGWNTNDLRSTLAKNWSHLTRWIFLRKPGPGQSDFTNQILSTLWRRWILFFELWHTGARPSPVLCSPFEHDDDDNWVIAAKWKRVFPRYMYYEACFDTVQHQCLPRL